MKKILTLIFLGLFFLSIKAQVTIGAGEEPIPGALLQLKSIDKVTNDTRNAYKGLALPRVTLSDKNQLYPMFLKNPDDPASGPDAAYQAGKADIDKSHTGLIVYNLTGDDDKELCSGLNQWDGEKWNCFQSKMGNAVAKLGNCDSLRFMGQYQDKVALTSGNYMTIPLHVTRAGAYTITAMADPDNGYYFTASGVFLTTGYYFLSIPGAGTPLKYTPDQGDGDLVKVTLNNKPLDACDPLHIAVEDSSKKPLYTMSCSKTKVYGVYQLDKELNEDNYITVTLDVDMDAIGATYIIETNTIDGIYFKGQGMLSTVGEQTVTLKGYGIPSSYDDKVFTITSNSTKSAETCKATVSVSLATKVTYGWGWYNNTAGYIMQVLGSKKQGTRIIADANVNFGTDVNSKVKVVKHSTSQTFDHSILSGELMAGAAYVAADVKKMFDKKPEIVLVGYELAIGEPAKTTIAGYMVNYLKAGGVLILALQHNSMAISFFKALYPGITISATWRTNPRFQLGFMDDEILNGPFGDIRGLYWGNDCSGAISITGLPEEDLVVMSRDSDGKPIAFKHKYFNLFFIGEGGVFANFNGTPGSNAGIGSVDTYPLAFDTQGSPITRTGWGGGDVENGRLFANIMAWAVKQAQFNGINAK